MVVISGMNGGLGCKRDGGGDYSSAVITSGNPKNYYLLCDTPHPFKWILNPK